MDSDMWDERYSTKEYVWAIEPNQFVKEHLGSLTPGTAIDLGAGEGRNAVWLASLGWQVTAVDFSAVALEKGEKLAADHEVSVNFEQGDARTYQASEPVDLVVLSYLQLPTADQTVILDHAKTWVRPGGILFVIAHDESNIENGYGGPPSIEVCYTVDRTVSALEGLDIVTADVAERTVETPDGPQIALDTLVVATHPSDTTR
ncbi:cypemycin methyltransferase [bacterium BMS3Bbin02]|nr:cypemycin methyltransferase [bacterium BMS3Bbin02]